MLLSLIVLADVDGCSCVPGQSLGDKESCIARSSFSTIQAMFAFTTKYLDTRSPPSSAQRYNSAGGFVYDATTLERDGYLQTNVRPGPGPGDATKSNHSAVLSVNCRCPTHVTQAASDH